MGFTTGHFMLGLALLFVLVGKRELVYVFLVRCLFILHAKCLSFFSSSWGRWLAAAGDCLTTSTSVLTFYSKFQYIPEKRIA